MLTLKSRSIIGLRYDILKERKIGKITIPYSRLWKGPYGDISIEIKGSFAFIEVPLKGKGGFVAAGYRLIKDDEELASVIFPARGTSEQLIVNWHGNKITFKKIAERIQLYLNSREVGGFREKGFLKKDVYLEIYDEIPIDIQVFSFLAYSYYRFLLR